jgi:hypothetical protein
MVDFFLKENEYRIFKHVEITVRREKGEKIEGMNQFRL